MYYPIDASHQCLGLDPKTHKIGYVQGGGGAIGVMGNLIAVTFTPPAHTRDFVHYMAGNFGIAKPVLAADSQGMGFAGLTPLLAVWTAFRNITYLLFVLIFVIIGFAIMLRVHIDPRTVMTIENQIPRIVVALILVTFSFAIAGFLIDLMYVFIYLAIGVFQGIDPDLFNKTGGDFHIQGENALAVFNNLVGYREIVTNASGSVGELVRNLLTVSSNNGNIPFISGVLNTIDAINNVPGWIIGWLAGVLAFFIISIAVLYALFKLWFSLIMAYIFILLDVVFAPFWILAGLVPGGNISFTAWLREIGGELLAFPAALVMLMLGKVFMDGFGKTPGFFPPLLGNPGGGDGTINVMQSLIGVGIILMTPTAVSMMKGWLKAPKFDIAAIGQAVGAGAGFTVNVPRQIGSILTARNEAVINPDTQQYTRRETMGALLGKFLR